MGTFVGFGFGAIQAGLFLYEAQRSNSFRRLVVAEIDSVRVTALRQAGGYYGLNIAHRDHVESLLVGPIEIYNPNVEEDWPPLTAAIAEADELASAIPSVAGYGTDGPASLHRLLAGGLKCRARSGAAPQVIYTAENDTRAAQHLAALVAEEWPETQLGTLARHACFVNTVIGKMSGIVSPAGKLLPITKGDGTAFLVEAFNRIYISQVRFESLEQPMPWPRGLAILSEKADLQPFEEAKFYGHNAVHALAAYMGLAAGVEMMSELTERPGLVGFLHDALLLESGVALRRKFGVVDALFTEEGFRAHADDLMERMLNPFLQDSVARVGRDPARKLGWNDRLIGAIRLALGQDIRPVRYAMGAAAALEAFWLERELFSEQERNVRSTLQTLWRSDPASSATVLPVLELVEEGYARLQAWRDGGFRDPNRT